MYRRRPLSDAWLFWDAERLDGYPHSDGTVPGSEGFTRSGRHRRARQPLRLRLLQDILLYGAGVASALLGVGLAVLLGSFISAYSVLSEVDREDSGPIVEYPASNTGRLALLSDAAAEAQKRAQQARETARDEGPADIAEKPPGGVGQANTRHL